MASNIQINSMKLRDDFPVFADFSQRGEPLHYLDNAAGTFRPQCVIDAITEYYTCYPVNVHRSMHSLSERATDAFEATRDKATAFLHASDRSEIIFTRGTTEGINLVADCWCRSHRRQGSTILVTEMEHHSNMIPWRLAAERYGLTVQYVPVSDDGVLDLEAYQRLLSEDVCMVAVNHMSNVLGTLNPMEQIIQAAHACHAMVCVDAAQSAAHIPLNVQQLNCDFLAFSGHKLFGPTGTGILYGRADLLNDLPPFMGGGDMINTVTLEKTIWADLPAKLEAGTPNIAGMIGLGAAIDFINQLGFDAIVQHTRILTNQLIQQLQQIDKLRIAGGNAEHHGVVSFTIDGIHPHDIAQFTNEFDVAIRAGSLCAQPLVHRLGHHAVCRASLSVYNHEEDINQLIKSLEEAVRFFHGT